MVRFFSRSYGIFIQKKISYTSIGTKTPLISVQEIIAGLHDYKMHYFFKKQYIVGSKTLVHIYGVVCVDDLRYI